ncbi:Ribosomal protein L13e [Penicillium chrysogenum]|nr:Ribosomal protein L13e [Penicillium chrysogenum]
MGTSFSAVKEDLTSNPRRPPPGSIPIRQHDFHKDWQRRVRVHFDQPGRKHRRREARIAKAAAVAPRPVDKLRPVVRCPTIKYNRRVRAGRGFTLAELKEAGIPKKLAPTVGLQGPLDPLPRKSGQFKKLDSSAEEVKAVKATVAEGKRDGIATRVEATFPITNPTAAEAVTEVKRDSLPKGEEAAYRRLRDARAEARYQGMREKRAKTKAEDEAAAKK